MENYLVRDLMVPLSEYATVPEGSSLLEAVLALEVAQEEYDHTKYKHRAVLILNSKSEVVGKLSHLDILLALEPQAVETKEYDQLQQFHFSFQFIQDLKRQKRMETLPLKDLCGKAAQLKVENFMTYPTENERISGKAQLDLAVNQLVIGKHLSLLVTENDKVVGILRLTDVFAWVFHMMKECSLPA